MKNYYVIALLLVNALCFAQKKQFNIDWEGTKILKTDYRSVEVPAFNEENFNYNDLQGLLFVSQWESNGSSIDENSVTLTNISYKTIAASELKDLNPKDIPSSPSYQVYNTNARGRYAHYLEMHPIIKEGGGYKKVVSFTLNYSVRAAQLTNSTMGVNDITNSVLSSGEWYRFYIEDSGVFKLSRNFLSNLGVNTNAVDPRTIKLYGNGGRMLPLENSENYPFDVVENAIRFVGEEDGSFDNADYILFYGEGPKIYNEESDTNINLYTDKTYYYINVGSSYGKRIDAMPTITADADFEIDTFQDYQFYEVDEYNLASLGRRWFGDDFDIESQRTYEFDFPNLVTSVPVNVSIAVGAVSEVQTSMGVTINDNL
ncbi:MAG: peptidase C25, partial [Winogradskyella arenosi]